jgi:hypothetical protein
VIKLPKKALPLAKKITIFAPLKIKVGAIRTNAPSNKNYQDENFSCN